MADLRIPELNNVIIAGNLTKDPVFRQTTNGTPVANFFIAANRRYRDANNRWQEEVCYVGVVAWNKLAESCRDHLKKGSAVLIDGELQSRTLKGDDGSSRSIVEIKARRIQFLNRRMNSAAVQPTVSNESMVDAEVNHQGRTEEEPSIFEDDSFDKFLTQEESELLRGNTDPSSLNKTT